MDELLALFDENPPEANLDESSISPSEPEVHDKQKKSAQVRSDEKQKREDEALEKEQRLMSLSSNVDDRVGFKITKRLVSSMDLLDMLSSNPYYSPASLSAMSLKQLNTLLVDPAQVIDKATVAGKTNLMTVGIVFTNTGTRVASSGNAFTIVTIGTLRTGPSVSLLLFGSVYRKFCRSLVPGKAVAIMYPRLVPPKGDYSGETSITFSLNEERQIVVLGTATDFGICKAKVRGKNEKGIWVADARRCKKFVDTSVCQYCQTHRSQVNAKKGAAAQARMQEIRQQNVIGSVQNSENIRNGRVMTMPTVFVQNSTRFSNPPAPKEPFASLAQRKVMATHRQHGPSISGYSIHQHSKRGLDSASLRGGQQSKNSILNPQRSYTPANAKAAASTSFPSSKIPLTGNVKTNPYKQQAKGTDPTRAMHVVTPATNRRAHKSTKQAVKIADLISTGKRSKVDSKGSAPKKARTINTEGVAGFDGTVAVPKPKGRMASSGVSQNMNPQIQSKQHEKDATDIRERQREIAEELRRQTTHHVEFVNKLKKKKSNDDTKPATGRGEGWCAPLDNVERERLRNVKSAFSSEADAELFVATRRAITELEKEEERKTKNKKCDSNENKHIRKMWRCLNCQQLFQHYPKRCFVEQHDVSLVRELLDKTSREQTRTILSSKKTEEGGLKLGSGIEWTWSRFS